MEIEHVTKWVKEEIEEIKNALRQMTIETQHSKPMGYSKISIKRGAYRDTGLV